jgi:hypothetical protein
MLVQAANKTIHALSGEEENLVSNVLSWLDSAFPEESRLAQDRLHNLRELGNVVFNYPSVRDSQTLKGDFRDENRLLAALCSFSSASRLLHIPTKVVAVRSYLVSKFHTFALLARICRENAEFYIKIREVILSVVSTLMAEEVYFSCLEDSSFPSGKKPALAQDLVRLWDSGTDARAILHLPALKALWTARDAVPPVFGTMNGSSELFRITMDMGEDWYDFLVEETENAETHWALEEFLFGLSFEEIAQVRERLTCFGINAVGWDEVHSFLGSRPSFTPMDENDLRSIYDFFIDRRDAALFRMRVSVPGPRHTLEEIYLKYRILQEN